MTLLHCRTVLPHTLASRQQAAALLWIVVCHDSDRAVCQPQSIGQKSIRAWPNVKPPGGPQLETVERVVVISSRRMLVINCSARLRAEVIRGVRISA